MPVSAEAYVAAAHSVIDRVAEAAIGPIREVAGTIADALRGGAVIQAFGTGHSEALAMEIAGRAGGLVPTNRIALRDIVLLGDAQKEVLSDTTLERRPEVARRVFELAAPDPRDVFVLASNSGVNGAVVELAMLARDRGHHVTAITSAAHSTAVASRHPSGKRLFEVADTVLDNGAPYADAVLPLAGGDGAACAISSITGAVLAQMLTAEIVRRFEQAGERPPIYLSANAPGGDEHNQELERRYAGRIRRTA